MQDRSLESMVGTLLALPQMQALWLVKDRGIPVFAHTVDVTLLCLDRFRRLQEDYPRLNLRVVTLGSLLHDMSKASARAAAYYSHSWIMNNAPQLVASEAKDALADVRKENGHGSLTSGEIDSIVHVVVSHHGQWGRIQPQTPEAQLVHVCDLYSARNHRLAPCDANDILPHLYNGRSMAAAADHLRTSPAILKKRLREACIAEMVDSWQELIPIWESHGAVVTGDVQLRGRLERVQLIMQVAKETPGSLLQAIAAV